MRIEQLGLVAYGSFRGLTLDFSAPGIHVIFGKNEAGKSTTLRAITGLLYGIDHQTSDAYVHASKDLSIVATLTGANDERLVIVRRKGTKNTLLDEQGQPIEESKLARLLEGVGRDTFKRAFGLDHETLRTGAAALLEGKGDLGESLFDASVGGGGDVQRLLAELAAEADRLYVQRGSKPLLNEAIRVYTEAKKAIANTERLPQAVRDQEDAIAKTSAERDAKTNERNELAAKKALLERASRRIPLEKERVRLLEARAGSNAIAPHVARLDSLKNRLSAYERDLRESRDQEAEASRLAARSVEAARRAGAPNADEALRLDSKKEARIAKLVQERTTLEHRLQAARTEIGKAERELARLREVVSKKPADVTRLLRATREAQSLGEAEARLAAASSKVERRRLELTARAARLFEPKAKLALEEMLAIPVPDADAVSVLVRRADKNETAMDCLETRRADLAKEASRVELVLAENTGALAAPEPADLAKARAAREALTDPKAYRVAVLETDALADRMIREADRVATVAKLRSSEAELKRQVADVEAELARIAADRAAIDRDHAALFAPSRVEVKSLTEMRGWLEKHAQIASEIERIREAEAEVAEDGRRIGGAHAELVEALGLEPLFANKRLTELLDEATTRITAAEKERDAIETAARQIAKLEATLDERTAAVTTDQIAFDKTCAALAEAIVPLGVDAEASADEVNRAIEALRDLFKLADEHASVAARAASLAKEARAFEEDVTRAVNELAPDLAALSTTEAAASLAARGGSAQKTIDELARVEGELAAMPAPVLDDALAAIADDPERAKRELETMEDDIARLDEERIKLAGTVGGLEKSLADMSGETGAAEQAARAQEALAAVRAHAERYARVKLASVILEREISRFREENQGPMLSHASKLFSRLTLGQYASVRAGFDDADRPTIRCVRPDASTLDVGSLSEGTRDQLYLSLRLASLAMRAPLPLVLDDILVHFDDDRARAALEVLAEASKSMQVLFFTHHARMLDLAADLAPCTFHTLENVKMVEGELPRTTRALP